MARNTPLILVALVFFSIALYLLFSAPDDDVPTIVSPQGLHPCPYAEVLGLDEHSVNPHAAGGALPPITPAVTVAAPATAGGKKAEPSAAAGTPPHKFDIGRIAGMPTIVIPAVPTVPVPMKDEL